MKFLNLITIIFISLTSSIKADLNKNLINLLKDGEKIIFIRHAYAPGNGDPDNFNLNNCSTQRNLSESGKVQAKNIGKQIRNRCRHFCNRQFLEQKYPEYPGQRLPFAGR